MTNINLPLYLLSVLSNLICGVKNVSRIVARTLSSNNINASFVSKCFSTRIGENNVQCIPGVSKAKCSPNPCKNDGVCTAFEKHYECECPMGFMGKDCEGKCRFSKESALSTNYLTSSI